MEYEHNILGPHGKIITRNLSRLPRKIFRVFTRGVSATDAFKSLNKDA